MDKPDTNFKSTAGGDEQDLWLDKALRDLSSDHVDDGGFAMRVVDRLPARRRPARRFRWVVDWWIAGLAVAILAVCSAGWLDEAGRAIAADALHSLGNSVVVLGVSVPLLSILSVIAGLVGGFLVLDGDR